MEIRRSKPGLKPCLKFVPTPVQKPRDKLLSPGRGGTQDNSTGNSSGPKKLWDTNFFFFYKYAAYASL